MNRCPHCHAAVAATDASCPACRGALLPREAAADTDLLGGNFKLLRLLGTGGMGAVWLAEDTGLQRQVAVKLLAEKLCHDPDLVERFLREARLMARVDHSNVVPVHFVGRWNHVPFIVMKLLPGRPLSDHAQGRPLTLADIAGIARQVCDGLTALHAQGIVHRDIKPANLFVCDDGRVCLLDLGVARDADSRLTSTGALIGTPRYMAPEQIHGERVGPAADVYSLGVVLYELFAGRPMFDVSSGDSLLRAHVYTAPEPLTGVPAPVWAVLEKALQKEAQQRFASPAELSAALDAAVLEAGAGGAPDATWVANWKRPAASQAALDPTFPSSVRRRRLPLLVLGSMSVLGVAGGVAWSMLAPATDAPPSALTALEPQPAPPTPPTPPEPPEPPLAQAPADAGAPAISAAAPARPAVARPVKTPAPGGEAPPPLLPR